MASSSAPGTILIERGKGGRPLCQVAPSLTIYFKDPPTGDEASAALGVFRRFCPPDKQKLVSGSRAPAFARLGDAIGKSILSSHLELMNRRKDIAVALWDGELEESWYFTVYGVPPEHGKPRASFCKVTFPNAIDPEVVVQLASELIGKLRFLSGHGALTAQFDAAAKVDAFNRIFIWARRYLGIEVEDLNVTIDHVLDAIKGAGWLTLVGEDLWSRLVTISDGGPKLSPEIALSRGPHGALLRAGPAPVLGDRNAAELPVLQAEVERALSPLKLKEHGEFVGRFAEEKATMPWLNRFLTPDGWRW
jgi:hypothetical protein